MKEIEKTLKEVAEKQLNEGTSSPYWLIIDPRQNFEVKSQGVHNVASMITGPFFSREDAQGFLDMTHYNFSKNAKVYCHSGCYSSKYEKFCKEIGLG